MAFLDGLCAMQPSTVSLDGPRHYRKAAPMQAERADGMTLAAQGRACSKPLYECLMIRIAAQMECRRSGASPLLASKGSSANIKSHPFDWRDAMDIIVKWRQLSEPNDQVTFLNHLVMT